MIGPLCMWTAVLTLVFPLLVYGEGFLPPIEQEISIGTWLYAGPFSIGAREGTTGVIEEPEKFRPHKGMQHPSIMVQGGMVTWKEVDSEDGRVELRFDHVWWDTLQDIYGIAGVMNAAYAYGEFDNQGESRALVVAEQVGSFLLNGRRYPGGVYGHGYVRIPVILKDGVNRVLVKVGGAGDHKFTFKLIPPPAPVMVLTKDATLPDIIGREVLRAWAGVSILNTTSQTLRHVILSTGGRHFGHIEKVVESIPPLSVMKVPIEIETGRVSEDDDLTFVRVAVSYGEQVHRDSLRLRIRDAGESFKSTFISRIDNSCQYYAVLPPEDYDPHRKYGLILTLHGAGVEASGQVDAYAKKDWAFVVAPTNRRRFGFDWQDWGRLDCLEVLEEAKSSFPIDDDRVYLTGHSMGGHGTWHVGLSHADEFAAMAPSAGWTSFQLYVPWFLQKSYLFGHPEQVGKRDMVLREDQPLLFLENGLNLPIFVMQGGADNSVPPIQARFFLQLLTDLDYQFVYKEVPEKGHWWDEEGVEGTACVDHPELIDWLKNHRRDPHPQKVVFRTTDLGLNNSSYWVEIDEQETPYRDSRVEALIEGRSIETRLTNVAQLTLHLPEELLKPGEVELVVNGDRLSHRFKGGEPISIHRKGNRFRMGRRKHQGLGKTPSLYGPMKQAYFSPFLLVYGTSGDSTSSEANLHLARLEAFSWWRRANGFAQVLPDTEVTHQHILEYNLILFGNPNTNGLVERVNDRLPLSIRDGRVLMGGREIPGPDLVIQEIYPNPLNPSKLVVLYAATSAAAEPYSGFFSTLYSGAGVPDFLVYDSSVRMKCWGGVVTAGFFDTDWKLSQGLTWVSK